MIAQDHRPALCPEFALLIEATRWPQDDASAQRLRTAAAAVTDPQRLLDLCRRHHVSGLVARTLERSGAFAGTPLRKALAEEALGLAEEQFRQIVQTQRAVAALRACDIPVGVLKGAPAALGIYGVVGIRRSIDIDLLIARPDLERARDVLEDAGYAQAEPPRDATPRQMRASLRYGKDWAFDHDYSDTGIELHWRLFQNPRLLGGIGVADVVDTTVSPGITLPVLRPDIGLLYLVAHGAEHAWSRLKWLADLACVLRRDPAAADRLVETATPHGMGQMIVAALLLSHELYGTALPGAQHAVVARQWRTRQLLATARGSLLGAQDGTELEERPMATTRKNLSHYLFSADPRYWWRELGYDLFHDGEAGVTARLLGRLGKVARLPMVRLSGAELTRGEIEPDGDRRAA